MVVLCCRSVSDPPLTIGPVVLGPDEFALQKGHVYASVSWKPMMISAG
jgi:hypothetical protein